MPRSLERPLVCVVTGGAGSAEAVVNLAARASAAGADLFQIRERQMTDAALLDVARHAVSRVRSTKTAVLINDRLDIAQAAGAAGVHLRADSAPGIRVRASAPVDFLIGRSVHSAEEAAAAAAAGGLDYLIFGTVFPSASKPAGHATAGVEELKRACQAVELPVLAIGGVTVERVPEVAAAGAAGIAAIGLFRDIDPQDSLSLQVDRVKRAFARR